MDITLIFMYVSLIYFLDKIIKFLKTIYLYWFKRYNDIEKRYGSKSYALIIGKFYFNLI